MASGSAFQADTSASSSGWNWGTSWANAEDDDEEGEDQRSSFLFSGRDSVIFLIDCSGGMLKSRVEGGDKPVQLCIKGHTNRKMMCCVLCYYYSFRLWLVRERGQWRGRGAF